MYCISVYTVSWFKQTVDHSTCVSKRGIPSHYTFSFIDVSVEAIKSRNATVNLADDVYLVGIVTRSYSGSSIEAWNTRQVPLHCSVYIATLPPSILAIHVT
jgi:hypothetical protein